MNKHSASAALLLLPLLAGCRSVDFGPPVAPSFTVLGVAQTPAGTPLAGVLAERAVALDDGGFPVSATRCREGQVAFPEFQAGSVNPSGADGAFSAEFISDVTGPVCVQVRLRAPAGSGLRDTTLTPLFASLRVNLTERRNVGMVQFAAAPEAAQ